MEDLWAFTPLHGDEEEKSLEQKFSHLKKYQPKIELVEKLNTKQSSCSKYWGKNSSKIKTSKKSHVASGGHEIRRGSSKTCTRVKNVTCTKINSKDIIASATVIKPKRIFPNPEEFLDGFEFEKPAFSHLPCSSNEPFWLSEENNHRIPGVMNRYLRDYQRDGVKFMYDSYIKNQGAILGDDMGLGKTIQVIALLAALLQKTGRNKDVIRFKPDVIRKLADPQYENTKSIDGLLFLLVVPASVLYNWCHEFDVWGHFAIGNFHKNERTGTLNRAKRGKLEIVLTTFETTRTHLDEINTVNWNGIFVDEVHKIKEPKAGLTKALKSINVKCRFGLTGTVLQNSMKELWCLLDWANPNCLGSEKDFEDSYINAIEEGMQHDASKRQLAEARKVQEKFNGMLQNWMIRRTKALIKNQLPIKTDQVIFCKPGDVQKMMYKRICQSADVKLILSQSNPCLCGSMKPQGRCCVKKNSKGKGIKSLTFAYMQLLLKAANHLALLIPKNVNSDHVLTKDEILEFIDDPDIKFNLANNSIFTHFNPKYCGKIKVLTDLIMVFKEEKSKMLIFSYTTKLLDILESYILNNRHEYRRIDGKTRNDLRFKYVEEFNNDPNIFICLVSTKAGGIGLNMTGANIVVIFDPNWNPSHDLQAQDRAYRIGQSKDVQVYRLVCAGTIEENMYLRQIYKQQLEKSVIASENANRYFSGSSNVNQKKGELFGIQNIFQFREASTCLTNEILKRHMCVAEKLSCHMIADYIPPTLATEKELSITESTEQSSSEGQKMCPGFKKIFTRSSRKLSRKTPIISSSSEDSDEDHSPQAVSVNQVLRSSEILHVHANQDVVGASKAEDHMTKCAVQEVFVDNLNSQELAVHCRPIKKIKKKKKVRKRSINVVANMESDLSRANIIVGKTPPGVQMNHFRKMASENGKSVNQLANEVLKMPSGDLKTLLSSFYLTQYRLDLQHMFDSMCQTSLENSCSSDQSDNDQNQQPKFASTERNRNSSAFTNFEKSIINSDSSINDISEESSFTLIKQNQLCINKSPKAIGKSSTLDETDSDSISKKDVILEPDSDSCPSDKQSPALLELYNELYDVGNEVETKPPPKKSMKHNEMEINSPGTNLFDQIPGDGPEMGNKLYDMLSEAFNI